MKLFSLKKSYGEKTVLSLPDLELKEGEITAVLGESGAGKTTLLRLVAGLLKGEGRPEDVGRVSFLFQEPKLLPNLTAEGNLRLVLPKELWGEIGETLSRVGLEGREKSYPHELSGGEKQRVAIARAFLFPHDTLLMDEAFSSLDLALKRSLILLTRSLWEERRETVLFVTHDVHEAAMLASRALVLRGGTLCADIVIDGERDFFAPHPAERALVRALMREDAE